MPPDRHVDHGVTVAGAIERGLQRGFHSYRGGAAEFTALMTVVREIPNRSAIRTFGTPSPASLLISAQINAFVLTGITNARTEGDNRLVEAVKRSGCGFRNRENSARRIRFHCTARSGMQTQTSC